MSLHPSPVPPVPDETLRVARAAFPRGNLYVRMRDTFATLFEDAMFSRRSFQRVVNLPLRHGA